VHLSGHEDLPARKFPRRGEIRRILANDHVRSNLIERRHSDRLFFWTWSGVAAMAESRSVIASRDIPPKRRM
jgi:hypothetical protein